MNVMEAILTRRSIRKYTGVLVSKDEIRQVIKAGAHAPSAMNLQPWNFFVVTEPALLQQLSDSHPYAKMMPQAGCCIVVCADKEKQSILGYAAEDCSAAIQNMLLAAKSMGLGTVWCGVYPMQARVDSVHELLQLPESIVPIGLVALGHPAEERQIEDRYDEKKVHWNQW